MKDLIFGLIGGTALLMYGVDKMGEGLEKASGNMMRKILSVLTGNVFSAFLVGTILTALVQSSTAITVLTVGFVNAGLMKLPQAIGVIYGANIGTTITAQLMAFSYSFKLTDVALPILGVGFTISYFSKNKTLKNIGEALMGFGMMFLGLKILNSGIPYMKENETLRYFFTHYASIPVVGIVLGAVATALVHSSSATVGLVMVLAQAGLVDLQTSICIMLGDNIGTCLTAQLASMTGNIHARRTAWAHTLYNIFGVLLTWVTLPIFMKLVVYTTAYLQPKSDISAQIANSHTIFNLVSAIAFLPITRYYVKFLETFIRSKDELDDRSRHLDKLLLNTPIAAIKAIVTELTQATEIAKRMVQDVMKSLIEKDEKYLDKVQYMEDEVNQTQKEITSYIIELSKQPLTGSQSAMVPALMTGINNVERIGDHVMDLHGLMQGLIQDDLKFTAASIEELQTLENLILEMLDNAILSFKEHSADITKKNEELEDEVDRLSKLFEENHLVRLNNGECSVEAGVIFLDIINHFERIADHIYKISHLTSEELYDLIKRD